MNRKQLQVIAEKVSSTVRVLELLSFEYEVGPPSTERKKGNKSPRVVRVHLGNSECLTVYNSAGGATWACGPDGQHISRIKSVEDLYAHLAELRKKFS